MTNNSLNQNYQEPNEGPTTADVYIDISPFYGMAPATVSGYRPGGRRYAERLGAKTCGFLTSLDNAPP